MSPLNFLFSVCIFYLIKFCCFFQVSLAFDCVARFFSFSRFAQSLKTLTLRRGGQTPWVRRALPLPLRKVDTGFQFQLFLCLLLGSLSLTKAGEDFLPFFCRGEPSKKKDKQRGSPSLWPASVPLSHPCSTTRSPKQKPTSKSSRQRQ